MANQQMASKLSDCVINNARYLAKNPVTTQEPITLRDVAEVCKDELPNKKIQIDTAARQGSNHILKLSWKDINGKVVSNTAYFNILGSKLCNSSNLDSSAENLMIDLYTVLANTENAASENECFKEKVVKSFGFMKFGLFGFKTQDNGSCKRICKQGDRRRALRLPFTKISENKYSSIEPHWADQAPFYEKVECELCPATHPNTIATDNKCYDADGCDEHSEVTYIEGKNWDISVLDPKKKCASKCSESEVMNENGDCEFDSKAVCKEEKKKIEYLNKWLVTFKSMLSRVTISNCDKNKFRSFVGNWHGKSIALHKENIQSGCDFQNGTMELSASLINRIQIETFKGNELKSIEGCFTLSNAYDKPINIEFFEHIYRSTSDAFPLEVTE